MGWSPRSHVTTGYDILRHSSVELIKKNFLGSPEGNPAGGVILRCEPSSASLEGWQGCMRPILRGAQVRAPQDDASDSGEAVTQ